ncbi:ABC-type Mn2+/Zn2+ transport system permease subunit [Prauserella shujinwangii]|uniref:ABC-type Mn2+/Zn2+ transport system permease subunit n=1 Tax=Prauserella shujinwangii TaxID=1453103 RepID=A0A2T0LMY3_9PSEU|nr:ABC-type Mn2+/Zn2+ transport system permease subunit [Prauserella shujinwangii]
MHWLIAPFEVSFMQRALWGGLLVALVCALVGTWVVLRGMAFLGDAMAHGMLPGVAVASLLGGNLMLGAALSAGAMAAGVTALGRWSRLSRDTSIGLLFVGMLALGVIIVSHSRSFAVDLTGFLFGDVLAVRAADLAFLAAAVVLAALVSALGYRSFVALAFDPRKAHTLGLRPRWANAALLGLVTLAVVASFHVVGTLLVFGLLVAPPAAALLWARRVPAIMVGAALLGAVSVVAGLLVSWHFGTSAGATIVAVSVALFFVSALAVRLKGKVAAGAALLLVACGPGTADPASSQPSVPHGYVEGAEEVAEAQPRLVVADADSGAVRVVDLLTGEVTEAGDVDAVRGLHGDGRFAYLDSAGGAVHVIDSGVWTVDHGDHVHYYRAPIRAVGTVDGGRTIAVHGDAARTVVSFAVGGARLLDRTRLEAGTVGGTGTLDRQGEAGAVPYAGQVLVPSGDAVEVRTPEGERRAVVAEPCPRPSGEAVTRRGVVFGCADGALLVTEDDDAFTGEKIRYPAGVAEADRAREFAHRAGGTTLVARAGDRGLWALDLDARTWRLVGAGPVIAANTAGAGTPLLALTADGTLRAFDSESGREIARKRVLAHPVTEGGPRPVIEIDTSRAYVNDIAARTVHEIDYADDLRVARTFELDIRSTYLVETGR